MKTPSSPVTAMGTPDKSPQVHPGGVLAEEKPRAAESTAGSGAPGSGAVAPPELAPVADEPGNSFSDPPSHGSEQEPEEEAELDRSLLEAQQRQRRKLLSDCGRLLVFDFSLLAMPQWPESYSLDQARRRRDQWLVLMCTAAAVFLAGMGGLVPAWVAGTAFGAFTLSGGLAFPAIRQMVTGQRSYGELVGERRRLLRQARRHIARLEANSGLVWQCVALSEYNPAIRQSRFQGLINLSRSGSLASAIRSRAHVRLYLMFLLEAEKAFNAMQARYLEAQDEARERGWLDADGGGRAES